MTKNKIILVICVILFSVVVALILLYFSNVKICEKAVILKNNDNSQIFAISPSGGRIDFCEDSLGNLYLNRYIKDIYVVTDKPKEIDISIRIGQNSVKIVSSSLILNNEDESTYLVDESIYPEIGIKKKLSYIKSNQLLNLLWEKISKWLHLIFYFLISGILLFVVYRAFKTIRENYKDLNIYFRNVVSKAIRFIVREKYKIFVLYIICLTIPLVYYFFSRDILLYLDISLVKFITIYGSLIYPLMLLAFFSVKINTNKYFWWSFLIIFILSIFVFKSSIYLYGFGFRDDISKFFVKAYNNNIIDCLFTPDSGYLNVFQNLVSLIILKILGFKQYFPDALQIFVAYSFSAIFASFNLKSFKIYIDDDRYRFFISILFAVCPFILSSANFLFEIPFVIAAFLFLWTMTYFDKHKSDRKNLFLMFAIFILFILSKPIFIIFIPFIVGLVIYQFAFRKDNKTGLVFTVLLSLIVIQTLVILTNTQQLQIEGNSELGTHYERAFNSIDIDLNRLLTLSVIIYIRKFTQIFCCYSGSNGFFIALINFIAVFINILVLIIHFIKLRKFENRIKSVCSLSLVAFSFLIVLLYVKSVDLSNLISGTHDFYNLSFVQMFKSNIIIKSHRYLMLAGFANFLLIVVTFFDIADSYIKNSNINHISKIILILFISFNPIICKSKNMNKPEFKFEKVSYWRLYNKLIFDNPKSYYIPYNGFPEEKHCIKFKLDKIIDIKSSGESKISIDNLHKTAHSWEIQIVILENDFDYAFPAVVGITKEKEFVNAILVNEEIQPTKALVYDFNNLYNFDSIYIQYPEATKRYHGIIRLVGQYE